LSELDVRLMEAEMSDILFTGIGMFIVGWMYGNYRQDMWQTKMNRSQCERGDYWFDRYMLEVREDWTPTTDASDWKRNDEE